MGRGRGSGLRLTRVTSKCGSMRPHVCWMKQGQGQGQGQAEKLFTLVQKPQYMHATTFS